ncbi:MAG: (2Fe-2S)-binding protein, partial [Clostridium celatum]|nr:(2Fe-2S)-binding protein [Clostridium celatum]
EMDKNKKVCYCFNVSVDDIERAIENGADSFDEVQEATNCGKGCGSCLAEAKAVVEELLKNKRD